MTPDPLGTSPATIHSISVLNDASNPGTLTTSACLARPVGASRSVISMTTPLLSRQTLDLWTRFQKLELNDTFVLYRPNVLHGDPPTVQVMLRHLGGGDRASLSECPTPSVDQATSGCQKNGEGHWQNNLTGEMTYSNFNSEKGPNKGPRLRPEPLSIKNNGEMSV